MTITGNNDDNSQYGTQADPTAEPPVEGDNAAVHVKNPSGATTIDGLDVSSYEVGTAVKASSSYLSLLPNTTGNTKSTVSIYTNAHGGYNLNVKANTSANMTLGSGLGSDTIAAIANTPAVGTPGWAFKVADVTGKTNVGTINSSETPGEEYDYSDDSQMTTDNQNIVTAGSKTSAGDSFDVIYDVATKADQETGVYHVSLTYTATTR